jgi:hypothetical protein
MHIRRTFDGGAAMFFFPDLFLSRSRRLAQIRSIAKGYVGVMANPSDTSKPFWREHRRQIRAGLERERQNLEDFESDRMSMGRRSGNGPWRDVTKQWVEHQRRIIETFETVLTALEIREGVRSDPEVS